MLIRLKDDLDDYHQRRADKHGWLYTIVRRRERGQIPGSRGFYRRAVYLYEARSVATGVVCTFAPEFVEEADDAPELPR